MAYSALYTACDPGGSTSRSVNESRHGRVLRNNFEEGIESASEDGEDLVAYDNAFLNNNEDRNAIDQREIADPENWGDEYEDQATDGISAPAGAKTLGNHLKGLKWQFEEVERNSKPFDNPKSMFVGKTKLRRGVADSFKTPFHCFQQLGLQRRVGLSFGPELQ